MKLTDERMLELIAEFEALNEVEAPNSGYFSVTYVCIEGRSALENDFAIMTASKEHLEFYVFPKLSFNVKRIDYAFNVPFSVVEKLKMRKFFLWTSLKIFFRDDNGKKHKIKILISSKAVGLKNQKENLEKLREFLTEKFYRE